MPTKGDIGIGALVDPHVYSDYEGPVLPEERPEILGSTFTSKGLAYTSRESNVFTLIADRVRRGSLSLGDDFSSYFVKSGAEMFFKGLEHEAPPETDNTQGKEFWEALPEGYQSVLLNSGFTENTFAGLNREETEKRYDEVVEFVRLNDRISKAQEAAPIVTTIAGAGAFGINTVTDPLTVITALLSGGGSLVGKSLGKAALTSSLKKSAGKAASSAVVREAVEGTAEGALRKLSVALQDASTALQTGDSILTSALGIQSKVLSRAALATTGGSLAVGQDYLAQLDEWEILTEWDLMHEEFGYDWARGGVNFLVGVFASQIFAGGKANYFKKGNAAFSPYGVSGYNQARLRREVLNNPKSRDELLDLQREVKGVMLEKATNRLYHADDQRLLPWVQEPDWFDKLKDAGYDFDEMDMVKFLLQNPTRKEMDELVKKLDYNNPPVSVTLHTKKTQLAAQQKVATKALDDLNDFRKKAITFFKSQHTTRLRQLQRDISNTQAKIRRRVKNLSNAEDADIQNTIFQELTELDARLIQLKDSLSDAKTKGYTNVPRGAISQQYQVGLLNRQNTLGDADTAVQKLQKEVDNLQAKLDRDGEELFDYREGTQFMRMTNALEALLEFKKLQATGKELQVKSPTITALNDAWNRLRPGDIQAMQQLGIEGIDLLSDSPLNTAQLGKVAANRLSKVYDDFVVRNLNRNASEEFSRAFKEYFETLELLTPDQRNPRDQAKAIDQLFNEDFLAGIEFVDTGTMDKYVRQLGSRAIPFVDLMTPGAIFRQLESHLRTASNSKAALKDRASLGYIVDVFAHMGSIRQRKAAINPNKQWIGGTQFAHRTAQRKIAKAMEDYYQAIGMTRFSTATDPKYSQIMKDSIQLAGGHISASGLSKETVDAANVLRKFFDEMADYGVKNGALANKIENYIPIVVNPNEALGVKGLNKKLHQHYVRTWAKDSAKLHRGTLHQLDWIKFDDEGKLQVTELGASKLPKDANGNPRLHDVVVAELPDAASYRNQLADNKGQIAREADIAIHRRMQGTDPVYSSGFDEKGIQNVKGPHSDDDNLIIFSQDFNNARRIDQEFWLTDQDIIDSGVVQTNVFHFLMNYVGNAYKIHRQDFVNDYYGRSDISWDGMIEHLKFRAGSVADTRAKEMAEAAVRQIEYIDTQYRGGRNFIAETETQELAYIIRQMVSAPVSAGTGILTGTVEGGGHTLMASIFEGNWSTFWKRLAFFFGQQPEDAKQAFRSTANGWYNYDRHSHHIPGTANDRMARVSTTLRDRIMSPFRTLMGKDDTPVRRATELSDPARKPWQTVKEGLSRVGRAANDAAKTWGGEEMLANWNRHAVIDHELWKFRKWMPKMPALLADLADVDPNDAKAFRGVVRKHGVKEAYVRQILGSGLGDPDVMKAIGKMDLDDFANLGTFQAAMDRLDADTQNIVGNRIYNMFQEQVDTWNPAHNPFAQPSTDDPVGSFVLLFTSHANNFFQSTMANIGGRPVIPAMGILSTYAFLEYSSYIMRALANGYVTVEDLIEKSEEDPLGMLADMLSRTAFLGPWVGSTVGTALDLINTETGVLESKPEDLIPGAIGLDIAGGQARKVWNAAASFADEDSDYKLSDYVSAVPGVGNLPWLRWLMIATEEE